MILIYSNMNIVNNPVDYKSKSILVTHKKGMPVLYKSGASFKPDIIIVAYKLLILYLNILAYKLKQLAHKTVAFACIMQVNKSLRKIIKTYLLQCFFKNHDKH